jgi:hypothetical protein
MVSGNYPAQTNVEQWNGTNWTEVNDVNTAVYRNAAAGTVAAAIKYAGQTSNAQTELWNGSNWTEVGDLNTGRGGVGGTNDSYTNALCFGGTGPSAKNEQWNGASWVELGDLNTGRFTVGGTGSTTAGLCFGGRTPGTPHSAVVEEWSGSSTITKVLTD